MKTVISKEDIPTVLATIPNGSIFSVLFLKKDNSERLMVCRKGVHSYLNPNPSRPRPAMPPEEETVFDMQAKNYRMFNKNTTKVIKACHVEFVVEDFHEKTT